MLSPLTVCSLSFCTRRLTWLPTASLPASYAWPGKVPLVAHARELAMSIPAIAGSML